MISLSSLAMERNIIYVIIVNEIDIFKEESWSVQRILI